MTQDSSISIGLSISHVLNTPESMELIQQVGPKMCITTASQPGFLGFQANLQTGILPFAGRFGGGSRDMRQDMNPIRNYQYTMWENWEVHEEFHRENFDIFFELCTHCLDIVVEGPWEPVYEVVASRMPPVRSMAQITELAQDMRQEKNFIRFIQSQRCVVLAEHTALPGKEQELEKGLTAVMEALAEHAPGFEGYMVLRQSGVNPWGSMMLDPKSTVEARMTLGANAPKNPKPQFRTPEAKPHPTEYLLHTEWESSDRARMGLGKSVVNRKIREIHDNQVLANLLRGPYYMFFQPMMEEETWREMV